MEMNVMERLMVLGLLPQEGSFATLKVLRDLQMTLSLTEEELKEFELKQDGEQTTWNIKGNEEREIKLGEKATDMVVDALKKLDEEKKLTAQHMSLYEKFIENKSD